MKIENIIVKTVETEKLIDFLKIELKENQKLNIETFAVFENKFEIDPDCCFGEITKAHTDEKIDYVVNLECRIKNYKPDGSYSMRMDKPDFAKTMLLTDYLEMAKEVKLTDFIRFNYNPRIMGNQTLLMKYIRQSYAVPTA
jgi:hypothetical protein